MPNIWTVMDISKWALHASTRHLDTVAHNVANVNTPGYSRQEVIQTTSWPERTNEGWYGLGVKTVNVIQHVDKLILERITDKNSSQYYHDARLSQLRRLETLSNEAKENGLGAEITAFFNAWQEVSNQPESSAVRNVLKETSNNLIGRFQTLMRDITHIKRDLTTYIEGAVTEANSICRRIADLNDEITQSEHAGQPANDYRDERQRQIDALSELININWFEDADGSVTVMGGAGKTLVQGTYPNPDNPDPLQFGQVSGYSEYQLTWSDMGLVMDSDELTGGTIGAWLKVRDVDIPDMENFLNDLAQNLIYEVNRVHSQGVGLVKFSDVTGTYESLDATTSFNDATNTLPYKDKLTAGSFDIWVYENGTRRSFTIAVDPSDSLTTLADKINLAMGSGGVPNTDPLVNPVATIVDGQHLRLQSGGDIEFAFANDTSNALAVLGINTFFEGYSATNIALNQNIVSDVRNIAAGKLLSDGEHALGDNQNALDLADLKDADTMSSNSETFSESVISWAADLGTDVANSENNLLFVETAAAELKDQRDNVSGVNLDEEMVKMIQYQRSYQMAAKMISVADSLLATILEIK